MKKVLYISSIVSSLFVAIMILYVGCGGGGGGGDAGPQITIPAAATKMDTELKLNMARGLPWVANVESGFVFVLNPGTAPGMTVAPDTGPGALPNTVTFNGSYDGNGDGFNETTMSGHVTFNSDPSIAWSGASGQTTVDVSIPVLGHVYHGDVTFTILSDHRQVSGSGTFTEPITGNTTAMSISAASPLMIKDADATAGAVSNACGYSLSGQMRLDVTGSDGTLTSYWNYNSTSSSVAVNGTSFTDKSGKTTALPDSSVNLVCGSSGTINDWVGSFDQAWACLPYESGQARITLTVSGADTITIVDEDPPGSGISKTYQATIVGANTHAVKGFFIGGGVGNHYREDFNWTLRKNGSGFTQVSSYEYTEGPDIGKGGICVARGIR
jgi:hypothetical protein